MFSGISKGNELTESMLEDEGVQRIIEGYFGVGLNLESWSFSRKD